MFDKMKALMDMQKKMKEIKRELDNNSFDVESSDKMVRIIMNGSQEAQDVQILCDLQVVDKNVLQKKILDTFNKAIKRSHEIAAQKMKEISGLNIPGLT
jgi:DNA-binding YbaB/EbfC family protein